MPSNVTEGSPVLLVFREILPGDILKHHAASNVAPSGGGARDLRFRRAAVMTPVLSRMFPQSLTTVGVVRGPVRWYTPSGGQDVATVKLWRPTTARPGEVRLGQINLIRGWEIDEAEYTTSRENGNSWFYFLVLDSIGTVWARVFRQEDLEGENQFVRDYIRARLLARRGKDAVFGSVDFVTATTIP